VIRVLIIAHYAALRAGLRALLDEADDIEIVADVSSAADARRRLENAPADAVILDAVSDDLTFVPTLAELDCALVVLTDDAEAWRVLESQGLPGWGLLRREADGDEITAAIRAATSGLIVLDREFGGLFSPPEPVEEPLTLPAVTSEDPLSAREREVLQLMTRGLPNKQIAARLSISLSTVKFHVAAILAKMGAGSRTEAVTLGIRRGDVSL
jgi:DNA-binding NarL/FixJ family response regulator